MSREPNKLSVVTERGRMAKRLAIVGLILSAGLTLTVFLAGPVYMWSGIALFSLGLFPFTLALIFCITALVQSVLFVRTMEEEEEKILLEKRKSAVTSLLDISEDVRFTARHTYDTFLKYIPSAIACFCFVLSAAAFAALWSKGLFGSGETAFLGAIAPKNPINLAFVGAMTAIFSFICGVFFIGQAHVREFRFLRPAGSMLILGAVVMFLSAVCALLLNAGTDGYDGAASRVVVLIYAILTAEFLLNFVKEFYRPRTGEEQLPVYESRVLGVFTEPGGVMRNIASSLDYQFGFQVSKTWIYGFFQRYLIPAAIVWGFFFWLFTGIAEVAPGEVGIRERFGAFPGSGTEVLQPGVHLKLPWPCERIVRVPEDVVQTVTIGAQIDREKAIESGKVILWTGQHYLKEDLFLVATKTAASEKAEAADVPARNGRGASSSLLPASLLEVSLPLYFKAKADEPYNYAFQFRNVSDAVLAIGRAEATSYFASTDFLMDLSYGRISVSEHLRERIQARCDALKMGVDVLSVGMHDAHPPVGSGSEEDPASEGGMPNVAESFQDVVCAREEAASSVFKAQAMAEKTVNQASVDASKIVLDASGYKFNVTEVAKTDAERFISQMESYRKQPTLFQLRSYLDFLENDCSEIRKYVISSKIPLRNYVVNLESKPSLDLLDTDLSSLGK